jgi:hypothetical protein
MDNAAPPARIGLPRWAQVVGLCLLVAESPYVGRIVFESTALTCSNGPQMIGFALVHEAPSLLLLGIAAVLLVWLWFLTATIALLTRKCRFSGTDWLVFLLMFVVSALLFVPYAAWEHFDVAVCGPGSHGQQFLEDAAFHGDLRLVKVLLAEGHVAKLESAGGGSALSSAVGGGKAKVVTFLLVEGANVNAHSDSSGETPLMVAAYTGNLEMLQLLLAHGAEPCATNREGENAVRLALRNHRQTIADYLNAHYRCPAPPPPPPTSCAEKSAGACIEVH